MELIQLLQRQDEVRLLGKVVVCNLRCCLNARINIILLSLSSVVLELCCNCRYLLHVALNLRDVIWWSRYAIAWSSIFHSSSLGERFMCRWHIWRHSKVHGKPAMHQTSTLFTAAAFNVVSSSCLQPGTSPQPASHSSWTGSLCTVWHIYNTDMHTAKKGVQLRHLHMSYVICHMTYSESWRMCAASSVSNERKDTWLQSTGMKTFIVFHSSKLVSPYYFLREFPVRFVPANPDHDEPFRRSLRRWGEWSSGKHPCGRWFWFYPTR